jgi:beta-glucosidase
MKKFPEGFVWGTSTSSYQIEGAHLEDGKGPSIWDTFTQIPGKVASYENGNIAGDHYHKYKEDIALMADMGLKHYHLSISWSRVQPLGRGPSNPKGLQFYSDLIDELLKNDITPWVNLYHWDIPTALQLETDGFLNPDIADYYADYAELCFKNFGDRIKYWMTFNEPWVFSILGYGHGIFAPGRKSDREPYIVGHNMLRAHGKAVDIYRKKYQPAQKGKIGIINNCDWREPYTDSEEDKSAAQRSLEFFLGWFADPIYLGDYPESMKRNVGDRLPHFTEEDIRLIKGSNDFFGINHYSTALAEHADPSKKHEVNVYDNGAIFEDERVILHADPSWKKTDMGWNIVPDGLRKLLHWIDGRYGHPEIYITENGVAVPDKVVNGQVDDQARIDFLKGYISAAHRAIEEGVDLKGYFVWSFMDNFEWALGYAKRFGLHYVDFETGKRIPKKSAGWFMKVIESNGI